MSDTPRTDRHFDAWGVASKYDEAARAFAGRLEKELATAQRIAVGVKNERDAAIKKIAEEARLRGAAEAKADELYACLTEAMEWCKPCNDDRQPWLRWKSARDSYTPNNRFAIVSRYGKTATGYWPEDKPAGTG